MSNHFSQRFYNVFVVTATFFMMACSTKPSLSFESSEDAVNACRKELSILKKKEKASVKELTTLISTWTELQDTTYCILDADTTIKADSPLTESFFFICDSIRDEVTRLATAEERSIKDVLYMKVHTAVGRDKRQQSQIYKNAVKFYDGLNDAKPYATLQETLTEYYALLQGTEPFKKEGEMMDFISKEDRCFRSLMLYLKEVPQEDLQDITSQTTKLFDKLATTVVSDQSTEQNERLAVYLMMRLNRRIMQNAMACRDDLKNKTTLTDMLAANYRWMI